MTTDDKKRLEDIRDYIKHGKDRDPTYADDGEVAFLLSQIDKRDEALRDFIAAWENIGPAAIDPAKACKKAREALGEK